MSKNFFPIPKKFFLLTQFIFFLSFIKTVLNQNGGQFSEESMKVPNTVFGIGPGTFAVIVAIIVGALICVLGLAFPSPGVFILIGIVVPLLVFILAWFLPTSDVESSSTDNKFENTKINYFIIARWFHFLVMLLLTVGLFAPLILLFNISLIPQRVDSRAQKEYDEKYLKLMEEQRKRKYNIEDENIDQDNEKLPLVINRINNRPNIRRNNDNNLGNLINSTNSIQNNNNNSIGNNNSGQSSQLPPVAPRVTLRNEMEENRNKFRKHRRTGQSNQ